MNILTEHEREQKKVFDEKFNEMLSFLEVQLGISERDRLESFIADDRRILLRKARAEVNKILTDEIALAHTTKAGKTSRLTSAYMRIKSLLEEK